MEIPYVTEPRKDTGLYNSKVGIWLFLASEVMLFGAFFSSYILLRVGAEEGAWPTELLDVPIGTFNTIVLILSSVTVVLAWSALKLNKFNQYKFFQGITILCALTFIIVKSFEYRDKFTHYDVILKNGTRIDGHCVEMKIERQIEKPDDVEEKLNDVDLVYPVKSPSEKGIQGRIVLSHPVSYPKEKGNQGRLEAVDAIKKRKKASEEHGNHESDHEEYLTISMKDIAWMTNWGPWANTYFAIYFTMTALHALHVIGGALVIAWLWGPGARMWKTDPERYINRVEVSGLFWHFVDLVWIFLFPVLYLL